MSVCAYTVCNSAYAPMAVGALLSVRRWAPATALHVLTAEVSEEAAELFAAHDIMHHVVRDAPVFDGPDAYPPESFLWYSGPRLLAARGHDLAVYLDPDVYCNRDPFAGLPPVATLAGVETQAMEAFFAEDMAAVRAGFGPGAAARRIQSGVVYLNCPAMERLAVLAAETHARACKTLSRKLGDDGLLALMRHAHPELAMTALPDAFNRMPGPRRPGIEAADAQTIEGTAFYHFAGADRKPWMPRARFRDFPGRYFARKWRERVVDAFAPHHLTRFFPDIAETLGGDHLRFYWWGERNVGDLVTPWFLEHVCGIDDPESVRITERGIRRAERAATLRRLLPFGGPAAPRYCVSTGSVIRLCRRSAVVYGSGIRSRGQEVHPATIRSVRGPLTAARFVEEGIDCPPVFGDPGLLLPLFYRPRVERTHRVGVLPHYTEYEVQAARFDGVADVRVIDMGCGDLNRVIEELLSCAVSVSSSLHGLVFSHAYGVPTRHVTFSDGIFGDGTKFEDYYRGIGLERSGIDLSEGPAPDADKLERIATERLDGFDTERLLDAMFFDRGGMRRSARMPV